MAVIEISRIQVRRGQENQTGVPILAGGEFGWAADTEHLYIGLRREDGGARDANVRVLTENDLFDLINPPPLNLAYTYRSETEPAITAPSFGGTPFERSINKKNDDTVSVKDFGVLGVGGDEVASALIQVAVNNLFLDPLKDVNYYGTDSAKILYMPAGIYNVDTVIHIPRHTTIIGEGIGKTIINLISTASHVFQTIDSDPANASGIGPLTFDNYGMDSGITQPNYIHIEGMTIQFDSSLTNHTQCLPLISLDCSENSVIKNVKLLGYHEYGGNADKTYTGINLRGTGQLHSTTENLLIENCEFNGLYYGISSNYDIVNPTIQHCKFFNSVKGIAFNDPKHPTALTGPKNAKIINNLFENIESSAIYVGVNNSLTGTNVISMNNRFYDVGNLGGGPATLDGDPVINFFTDGNISQNDWFDRQDWQNQNILGTNLYPPLIQGRAAIVNTAVKAVQVLPSSTVKVMRFPITLYPQHLTITYSCYALAAPGTVDRMGKATCYIPPGSTPFYRFVDDYTTSATDPLLFWSLSVNSPYKYYEIRATHQNPASITVEYQVSISY